MIPIFVRLPVRFTKPEYSEEMANDMAEMGSDIDEVSEIGDLFVNPDGITSFNVIDGFITLRLNNGETWKVELSYREFKDILDKAR